MEIHSVTRKSELPKEEPRAPQVDAPVGESAPQKSTKKGKEFGSLAVFLVVSKWLRNADNMNTVQSSLAKVGSRLGQVNVGIVEAGEEEVKEALKKLSEAKDDKERYTLNGELSAVQSKVLNRNQNYGVATQVVSTGVTTLSSSIANATAAPQSGIDFLSTIASLINGWR